MYDFAVISTAAVPLQGGQLVALHGLRALGISLKLSEGGSSTLLVTPQNILFNELVHSRNLTLMSYEHGDDLRFVRNLAKTVILFGQDWGTCKYFIYPESKFLDPIIIVDAMVPMAIEYLGQWPEEVSDQNIKSYDENYQTIRIRNEAIMSQSDYLLCAGENQLFYYQGVLSAQSTYSPRDLLDNRIIDFPHMIIGTPPEAIRHTNKEFVLCWFGGLYPWIAPSNLPELFKAFLNRNPKYTIQVVGGVNDLIDDNEPVQIYAKNLLSQIEQIDNNRITIKNWVPYEEINSHLSGVSAVLILNPLKIEARLSWRTRILDILKSGTPIITDGIDQLSENLINRDMAIKLKLTDVNGMAESLDEIAQNSLLLEKTSQNIKSQLVDFNYKKNISIPLELSHRKGKTLLQKETLGQRFRSVNYLRLKLVINLLKKGELLELARLSKSRYTRRFIRNKKGPAVILPIAILVNPEISFGGANLVAIDLMDQFEKENFPFLLTYHGNYNNFFLGGLNNRHKPVKYHKDLISTSLKVIFVNSLSHPIDFWDDLFVAFDKSQHLKLFIYCHEDKPYLFLTSQTKSKLTKLLKQFPDRLQIASPSFGTNYNLAAYLNLTLDDIQTLIYPILPLENEMDLDPLYAADQEMLRFCVVGSTADDRKNHSKVIDCFDEIIKVNRSDLRKFTITFVGVGKDEKSKILSDEARKKLGDRYEEHGEVYQEDVIEILRTQDVLISISKYETLPKNVTEALMMGNLLIRNATSGMKEQLIEGKNGFLVDEQMPGDLVSVILKILDPKEVSKAQIQEMKINSRLIALDLMNQSEIHNEELLELLGSWLRSEN